MAWKFFFGRTRTLDEVLRRTHRSLNKAIRDLDREKFCMEQQEKKLIFNIRKMVKDGQMDSVKILAKDLVRTRNYQKKFNIMRTNLQGASLKIVSLRSQHAISTAMREVTIAMRNMNRTMRIPVMNRILRAFERENNILGVKEEIMNETLEDVVECRDDDDEESDQIIAQVLDELGLQLDDKLSDLKPASFSGLNSLPKNTSKPMLTNSSNNLNEDEGVSKIDADLQERLEKLRRG